MANIDDTKIKLLRPYWTRLEEAIWECAKKDSLIQRLKSAPWEMKEPAILEAWEQLTSVQNLDLLEEWAKEDMNPRARFLTDKALEYCRSKIHGQ